LHPVGVVVDDHQLQNLVPILKSPVDFDGGPGSRESALDLRVLALLLVSLFAAGTAEGRAVLSIWRTVWENSEKEGARRSHFALEVSKVGVVVLGDVLESFRDDKGVADRKRTLLTGPRVLTKKAQKITQEKTRKGLTW
jgi:hypothetical protein